MGRCSCKPRIASKPPESRREAWSRVSSQSQKEPILLTPGSWTSGLHNRETINFCYLGSPAYGVFLPKPWQTNDTCPFHLPTESPYCSSLEPVHGLRAGTVSQILFYPQNLSTSLWGVVNRRGSLGAAWSRSIVNLVHSVQVTKMI